MIKFILSAMNKQKKKLILKEEMKKKFFIKKMTYGQVLTEK